MTTLRKNYHRPSSTARALPQRIAAAQPASIGAASIARAPLTAVLIAAAPAAVAARSRVAATSALRAICARSCATAEFCTAIALCSAALLASASASEALSCVAWARAASR